jgi:preprotein translocase subunit SecG
MVIGLTIVHVLMCLAIIAIVLLQAGKGADIGSAFGGAGSQAVFGSMGTPTVLGKITTGVAVVFAITSFTLAMLGGQRGSSVVRDAPPATAPAAPAGSAPATPPDSGAPAAPAAPPAPAPATPPAPTPSTK